MKKKSLNGKIITYFTNVVKLKYMRSKRINKNTVNKSSKAGYIPGILAIIHDIKVRLLVSYTKYRIETHKTAVLRACFFTDVKLGPLH